MTAVQATSEQAASAPKAADVVPPSPKAEFRPDLEGLRGVAILLVLLFHARLPGFDGGFVGVDVFFVLSGFLITGLLIRERERSGRIDLPAFYTRRARRILPAAAVVLVLTTAAAWFFMAPLDMPRVADDAVASALSVGNIRFAVNATDYFGTDLVPSPILHYWSLGVEEQFYLVWPALLILATRFGRPRRAATVTLAVLAVGSYAAAFLLTDAAQAWAFYSLPTRAWQLALGGLLAAAAAGLGGLPAKVRFATGWAGLAAVLATLVFVGPGTPYPGVAALLPALGSAGVILGGLGAAGSVESVGSAVGAFGRFAVARLLATAPLRFLGRISYSLYLVHWPILVLPAAGLAVGEELALPVRLGLAGLSVVAGWASFRFVEQPIHRGPRFALPPRRILSAAGVAIALVVVFCGSLGYAASSSLADNGPDIAAAASTLAPTPEPTSALPSATAEPSGAASLAPTPTPGPIPLPKNVKPGIYAAANDTEPLEADNCLLGQPQVKPPNCIYGNRKGTYTVALVGDSHAAHWFPAVMAVAKERGWRVVPFVKLSCRFIDMPMWSHWYKRDYTECDTWKKNVVAKLQSLKPDLVIESSIRDGVTTDAADQDPVRQGQAMASLLAKLPGKKVIVVDTPISKYNVPTCLSKNRSDVRPCQTARGFAMGSNVGVVERTAAEALGAGLVDVTPLMCPPGADACPVLVNGMIVYRDNQHMTATFAASLASYLEAALPPETGASATPSQ